jgi:hypothetical protein
LEQKGKLIEKALNLRHSTSLFWRYGWKFAMRVSWVGWPIIFWGKLVNGVFLRSTSTEQATLPPSSRSSSVIRTIFPSDPFPSSSS